MQPGGRRRLFPAGNGIRGHRVTGAMTVAFDAAGDPVRPEIVTAFARAWDEIAGPGTWWSGAERVDIAAAARCARSGTHTRPEILAGPAIDAASVIAASPAETNEQWVTSMCEALGELRYVELVGVVARVMAIDTFHRLTGRALIGLPAPRAGEPTRVPPPDGLRRNRTWVRMVMPVPPFVLGAVPAAMHAMNDLSDALYMPMGEMGDPDWRRGDVHRTQVELVAAATSHANQCFY